MGWLGPGVEQVVDQRSSGCCHPGLFLARGSNAFRQGEGLIVAPWRPTDRGSGYSDLEWEV